MFNQHTSTEYKQASNEGHNLRAKCYRGRDVTGNILSMFRSYFLKIWLVTSFHTQKSPLQSDTTSSFVYIHTLYYSNLSHSTSMSLLFFLLAISVLYTYLSTQRMHKQFIRWTRRCATSFDVVKVMFQMFWTRQEAAVPFEISSID